MLKLFKAKSLKNTKLENTILEERTQEKVILKEGIGTSREATCTKGGRTRASLFGTYTPSKMTFAVQGTKGRSMVEMLGVLAIIGVLSIGGIQGYTLAMRKYQANEILNVAGKYALTLYTACQNAAENDPEQYGRRGTTSWRCPLALNFTDSGLGALPNGAQNIKTFDMNSWVKDNDTLTENKATYNGADYIFQEDNGDVVTLEIKFNSVALCETAQGIMGKNFLMLSQDEQKQKTSCADKSLYFVSFIEN